MAGITPRARLRALVIDDSPASRRILIDALSRSPLVEVAAVAVDGDEALRLALTGNFDFATLDLELPRLDGFSVLRILLAARPLPVVVVSSRTRQEDVFRALELGALDFVAKPDAGDAAAWRHFEEALLRIAHAVALRVSSPIPRAHPLPQPRAELPATARRGTSTAPRAIATGSSTGGPGALVALLTALGPLPASSILIAQHMPEGFTRGFADRLARVTGLRVAEARDAEQIEPGGVWLAPGGAHLEVERSAHQLLTRISKSSAGERNAPSVDRLFESAAKHWGAELTAVVLTGMGYDGSRGVRAVRAAGGRVIAESEETAVIYGMPKRAIETGCVDRVVPLREIASELAQTRG